MFSLDVVVWKGKRSEHEATTKKAKQQRNAAATAGNTLPRVMQDKKTKQIYGKTTQEMYESYLNRVDHWMQDAPVQDWTKAYDKETYSKAYVPRDRHKDKDLGGPSVKIGYAKASPPSRSFTIFNTNDESHNASSFRSYSPRAVYKGGGKCVRHIVDPKAVDESELLPREIYRQRIANFEKTREKHKELHPPMMIPKNKPLSCGKFFVQDVICCNHEDHNSNQQSGCRKCAAKCCASPLKTSNGNRRDDDDDDHDDVSKRPFYQHIHSRVGDGDKKEPPPTAEYVASPQWRVHSPHKWVDRDDFSTTIASTTSYTAAVTSISGKPYKPSLLIAEKFKAMNRGVFTPTSPFARALEHDRRVQTATIALNSQRSPKRTLKKYFNSMWTEPGGGTSSPPKSASKPAALTVANQQPQSSSTRLAGRDLVLSLREQAKAASSPPNGSKRPS